MPPAMVAPASTAALPIARPIRPRTPNMPIAVIAASWASAARTASRSPGGTVCGCAAFAAHEKS
jgi:hypothetical protein